MVNRESATDDVIVLWDSLVLDFSCVTWIDSSAIFGLTSLVNAICAAGDIQLYVSNCHSKVYNPATVPHFATASTQLEPDRAGTYHTGPTGSGCGLTVCVKIQPIIGGAKDAEFVTSHCDGAFVLAKAGLLDNVASTTFPSDIEKMREMFPDLDIRDNTLFVHDGKYITSAGGAKSFEAALYLCEYLYGKEIAKSLAGGLVIDWNLDSFPHTIVEQI